MLRIGSFEIALLLAASWTALAASPPGERGFNEASYAFRDGFYKRAEAELAAFVRDSTNSARVPEAVLLQAQARLKLQKIDGAIELLTGPQSQSVKWADQFLFWLGQARLQKGEFRAAADTFAQLPQRFPGSSRCVEAAIGEATALSRLGQWQQVADLLQGSQGVFQSAVRTNLGGSVAWSGYLLLARAQLALNACEAAQTTLLPLTNLALPPPAAWEWQYLMCRVQSADGRLAEALEGTTNLFLQARMAKQRELQAQSYDFQAGLFERLGRTDEAIGAYEQNLAEGTPPDRQREALQKISELLIARQRIPQAIETLDNFLARFPGAPSADLALLTAAELRLRQSAAISSPGLPEGRATNAAAWTNLLQQATNSLRTLVERFPQSPLLGKAYLDWGWCCLRLGKVAESQAAFQTATTRLPFSADQADAWSKLGDAQFQQRDFTNAIASYGAIRKFESLPAVKSNLLEPALYQIVRAGLQTGDLAAASNALAEIIVQFPQGFQTERAVLLAGQEFDRRGDPAGARALLERFATNAPNARLIPEIELLIAQSLEGQDRLPEAMQRYDAWLTAHTNHPARAEVEYHRAQANYLVPGHETNAVALFTSIAAEPTTNTYTALARWWLADFNFRNGNFVEAEKNYELLEQTFPGSPLSYQAILMAGRAALGRKAPKEAQTNYFIKLYGNTNCPTDLQAQALFAYGDTAMSMADPTGTNKDNYGDAINAFDGLIKQFPTNRLVPLAMGERANCLLQMRDYERASKAYQDLTNYAGADAHTRGLAAIGLGVVLENQAQQRTGADQTNLLNQALSQYLNVLYGKYLREGEAADPFTTRRAGLEAARVAEGLGQWLAAGNVYRELQTLFPSMRARLEKDLARAREHGE